MTKTLKRAGRTMQIVFTVFLAVFLVCNLYFIFAPGITGNPHPDVFGFSTAIITSGSMEPELSPDDIILIRQQDNYNMGDIITFQSGGSLVTHRIVAVTGEGYITRGDANNADDAEPTVQEEVLGEVVACIPRVGSFIFFLKTPLGLTILILAGFLLIELPFLLGRKRDKTRNREVHTK
ncbi:MAG: signal peptidase I [Evtepia sp.]|nr:signal peptidase I [Evtepia sp.]